MYSIQKLSIFVSYTTNIKTLYIILGDKICPQVLNGSWKVCITLTYIFFILPSKPESFKVCCFKCQMKWFSHSLDIDKCLIALEKTSLYYAKYPAQKVKIFKPSIDLNFISINYASKHLDWCAFPCIIPTCISMQCVFDFLLYSNNNVRKMIHKLLRESETDTKVIKKIKDLFNKYM